jgi:UDP-N-acetylglucosamine 4,6-dehydratase
LLTAEEARHTKEFDNYYIIEPESSFWNNNNCKEGKSVSCDFCYSSDSNKEWFDKEKIKEL